METKKYLLYTLTSGIIISLFDVQYLFFMIFVIFIIPAHKFTTFIQNTNLVLNYVKNNPLPSNKKIDDTVPEKIKKIINIISTISMVWLISSSFFLLMLFHHTQNHIDNIREFGIFNEAFFIKLLLFIMSPIVLTFYLHAIVFVIYTWKACETKGAKIIFSILIIIAIASASLYGLFS